MGLAAKIAFHLARRECSGVVVRWVFGHASRALPVRRVAETARAVAFRHPRPLWPAHLLVVPKIGVPRLLAIPERSQPFVRDTLILGADLARAHRARGELGPISLIVNGGASQEVGQLHFHLIAGSDMIANNETAPGSEDRITEIAGIEVWHAMIPSRTIHLVLRPKPNSGAATLSDPPYFQAMLRAVADLVARFDLARPGFSLIFGSASASDGLDLSRAHLVSGEPMSPSRATDH